MKNGISRRAIPVCLALLAACEGGVPTAPHDRVARAIIPGDYELAAAGQVVSNAWEQYDVRLEGTIRIEQHPMTPSKLLGTFTDLRFVEGQGLPSQQKVSGVIAGTVDEGGSVILELTADSGNFTWIGRGVVLDSLISGQWHSSISAAGGFTARLKPVDMTGSDNGFRDFSHLEVTPAAPTLLPNEMIDLEVVPRDRFGGRMGFPAPVRYSTSAPEVAVVSSSGVIAALRPGTADITVDVSSNGVNRKAVVRVTVVSEIAYPDIDGVYGVEAPFTGFDWAWGDFTGYRYTAVFTLKRDKQGPGLGGTFSDLQLVDAAGGTDGWRASGTIRGTIGRDGKISIEVKSATNSFIWDLWGRFTGTAIEGTWFRAGHLSGTFKAVRR